MAAILETWDFQDDGLNGGPGLINRQKSAGNLIVVALDSKARTGRFRDRASTEESQTTLRSCNCRDFSFVGKSPRKKFQPCMHIYRLAMELGLLEPQYLDHDAREALQRSTLGQLKQAEDERLRGLGRDPKAWGGWPAGLHQAGLQQNRQYRAYFLVDDEGQGIERCDSLWHVREYRVALDRCSCPDFDHRQLPCKHIYAVAILQELAIAVSRSEYESARREGQPILFEFPVDRIGPLTRF